MIFFFQTVFSEYHSFLLILSVEKNTSIYVYEIKITAIPGLKGLYVHAFHKKLDKNTYISAGAYTISLAVVLMGNMIFTIIKHLLCFYLTFNKNINKKKQRLIQLERKHFNNMVTFLTFRLLTDEAVIFFFCTP